MFNGPVLGKQEVIKVALTLHACRMGHLLLEDVPGTGKTSLAKANCQHGPGVPKAGFSSRPDLPAEAMSRE